jgi:hypothetical protein
LTEAAISGWAFESFGAAYPSAQHSKILVAASAIALDAAGPDGCAAYDGAADRIARTGFAWMNVVNDIKSENYAAIK